MALTPPRSRVAAGHPGPAEPVHLLRPVEGHGQPSGPVARRLVVGHVHGAEAAEVLLRLDEGSVGEDGLAVLGHDAADRGVAGRGRRW